MSLRISSAALALAGLSACGTQSPEPGGIPMDCAIGAGSAFDTVCHVMEVKTLDEVAYFVLWHPDGGFRRIRYRNADRSVEVLDGAEPATGVTHLEDGSVEFAIEVDRYRLPARMAQLNEAIASPRP